MPGDILSGYETKDSLPSVTKPLQLKQEQTGDKLPGLSGLKPSKSEQRQAMADNLERAAEAFADGAWNQLRRLPGSAGFSAREWKAQTDFYLNDTLPKYLDTLPQYQNNPQAKEDFLLDIDGRVRYRLDRDVIRPIKTASTLDAYGKMIGAGIDNFLQSARTFVLPRWDALTNATDDEKVETARYLKRKTDEYNAAEERRRDENPLYRDLYNEADEDQMIDRDFLTGVWKSDHTAHRIANLVLTQAPQLATSLTAAGAAAVAAPVLGLGAGIGAVVTGAALASANAFMGMSEVAQNIFQDISEAPREELLKVPSFEESYKRYLDQGDKDEDAYDKAVLLLAVNASRELSLGHAIPMAILGLLGPEAQIMQKGLVGPLLKHGIFKRSLAARATARVALGGTAEGLDEVGEGVSANYAVNSTLGRDTSLSELLEGARNNFEAGGLAGIILGGLGNINEARHNGRPSTQTAAEAEGEAASQGGDDIDTDGTATDGTPPDSGGDGGGSTVTEDTIPGQQDETARRAAAEQSLKWLDDYFEPYVKSEDLVRGMANLNDDDTLELAAHIRNVQNGAPTGTAETYFNSLIQSTQGRVQIDPRLVMERAARIEEARNDNPGDDSGDAPAGITDKIINDAREHRRQVSSHSGGLRGYMNEVSGPNGKRVYTGIDTGTGETFSVHLGDLAISRKFARLSKGLDPNSEADVHDFMLRTEDEYTARGMDRKAAALAARAAAQTWRSTGKARASEIRHALFELGERDWQTVADMEVGNADNTAGGRGSGQQSGPAADPGQADPAQTGPGDTPSAPEDSSTAPGGRAGGHSRQNAREAAPPVSPDQSADGTAGGYADRRSGSAEPAADDATAGTGTGGPAGETEQRAGDDGRAETDGGTAQPGLSNKDLDQVLSRLGFYEHSPREMTAFRNLFDNAMRTMRAAFNPDAPAYTDRNAQRAFQVAAMTYARTQMYIAHLCGWNADEIIKNASGTRAAVIDDAYGVTNLTTSKISIDSSSNSSAGHIAVTMIHETGHALIIQARNHKAELEQTAQGREFLDALRSIATACGVNPVEGFDILDLFAGSDHPHERFAIALEAYFTTGKLPPSFGNLANDPTVLSVFERVAQQIKQSLAHVYKLLARIFGDVDIALNSSAAMDNARLQVRRANPQGPVNEYFERYELPRTAYIAEGKVPAQITSLFNKMLGDTSAAAYQFDGMENTAPDVLGELAHAEVVLANRILDTGYEGFQTVDGKEAMNIAHELVASKVKELLESPEYRAEAARRAQDDAFIAANAETDGAFDDVVTDDDYAGVELDTDEATVESLEQGIAPPGADPEGGIETSVSTDPQVDNAATDEETDAVARTSLAEEITEEITASAQVDTGTDTRRWITGETAREFERTFDVVRTPDGRPAVMALDTHSGVITETATAEYADVTVDTLVAKPFDLDPSEYETNKVLKDLSQAESAAHLQDIAGAILKKHADSYDMDYLINVRYTQTVKITCKNGETAYVSLTEWGTSYEREYVDEAQDVADSDRPPNARALRKRPAGTPPNLNPANARQAMRNTAQIIQRRARRNRAASQTAEVNRKAELSVRQSYSYNQAQEAGWWQRFARWMRRAWDSKSDLYMWNILNNSPTTGEAWSSPLNNAIQTTGARVDGARTELTTKFIDPLNDWARTKVKDLGLAPEKWSEFIHDMGLARTLLHTIESSALRRNQLQDALFQAYTLPYGPARVKAIQDAQNAITKYNQKQANKSIKNGVYLDGGRTEAECIALFNDIVAEYGQQVTEEGVERIGQSMEGLVQHLIEQNVMSESDVAQFRQFGFYVPLMTQTDIRRTDDVTELIASPNLMVNRLGSEQPAVDGMSTLEKYIGRAANALGARDLGTELQATYQRLAAQHAAKDPNVVRATNSLFKADDIVYYNGLAMVRRGLLQSAALAQGKGAQAQFAQATRDKANAILNSNHIVVRVVEDTDEKGNPKIPETVPYVVWFNRDVLSGTNGAGASVDIASNTRTNDALHSIYENHPPVGLNAVGRRITRFYGSLVTTFKPSFSIYNAQADFAERLAYTASRTYSVLDNGKRRDVSGTKIAALMTAYAANPVLLANIARYAWNLNPNALSGKKRQFMEEFKNSGIMSSASIQQYLQRQGDTAYAFLQNNPMADKNALQKLGEKGALPFRKWADMWYTVAPALEFIAMRKNGLSVTEARAAVLEQMNMRTKGSIDTMFGWALPFIPSIGQTALNFTAMLGLNATTFGHSRSGKTRAKAMKVWASMGALSIGVTALLPVLAAAFGDGDEDKGWKILDSVDLAGIDSIMLPWKDGEMVKVARVGFGPGRFILQAAFAMSRLDRGTAELSDVVKTMATSYMVNVSPFSNPVFDVRNMNDLGQKFAMMMTPAFLRPVAESFVYNRDFFGSTVVKNATWQSPDARHSDSRDRSTPRVWSAMAKSLYDATDGMFDVYPEQLRNMAKGWLIGPFQAVYKWVDDDPLVKDPAWREHRDIIGDALTLVGASSFYYKYGDVNQRFFYQTHQLMDDIIKQNGLAIAMQGKGPYDKTNRDKQDRVLRQSGMPPQMVRDHRVLNDTYYTLREMDKQYRRVVDTVIAGGRLNEARLDAICYQYYAKRARILERAVKSLNIYKDPSLRSVYLNSGSPDAIKRVRARGFMEQGQQ